MSGYNDYEEDYGEGEAQQYLDEGAYEEGPGGPEYVEEEPEDVEDVIHRPQAYQK